jgi:hypothetical protein
VIRLSLCTQEQTLGKRRGKHPLLELLAIARILQERSLSLSHLAIYIPGQDVEMIEKKNETRVFSVTGPDINWRWDHDKNSIEDLRLRDANTGEEIGGFNIASFSNDKQGTINLNRDLPGPELDLFLVTAPCNE